jgi:quinol monooxygenase YgiN
MSVHELASFRIKEGNGEEYIALLGEWLKKIEGEKGTLVWSIYRSKKDPLQWLAYGKCKDEEAFKFHTSPGQSDFYKIAKANILEGDSLVFYEPVIAIKEKPE